MLERTVAPPGPELVRDFLRFLGGDPDSYRRELPPHLFPQWSLPLLLEVARELPYPPVKVINSGCDVRIHRPIPAGEQLQLAGQLRSVETSSRRALITISISTAVLGEPPALEASLRVYVPLPKAKDSKTTNGARRREIPRVPARARELTATRLPRDAGLSFAELTGDFNPIHWLPVYARAVGFKNPVLHGFATLALTFEALHRALLAGNSHELAGLDVDFVRPLILPARVGVYLDEKRNVSVGDAPAGQAYMTGVFRLRDDPNPSPVESASPKPSA